MKNNTLYLTQASLIAALYVMLTIISNFAGLASGVIQLRLSEMLTILPVFTPAAIPGLAVGCAVANLATGCALCGMSCSEHSQQHWGLSAHTI